MSNNLTFANVQVNKEQKTICLEIEPGKVDLSIAKAQALVCMLCSALEQLDEHTCIINQDERNTIDMSNLSKEILGL